MVVMSVVAVAQPLDDVADATEALRLARVAWIKAICAAREHGCSYRQIGDASGLSPQGILKLVRRHCHDPDSADIPERSAS